MKKQILVLLGTALLWLAQLNIAAACWQHFYEPEVPEILKK